MNNAKTISGTHIRNFIYHLVIMSLVLDTTIRIIKIKTAVIDTIIRIFVTRTSKAYAMLSDTDPLLKALYVFHDIYANNDIKPKIDNCLTSFPDDLITNSLANQTSPTGEVAISETNNNAISICVTNIEKNKREVEEAIVVIDNANYYMVRSNAKLFYVGSQKIRFTKYLSPSS